MNERMTKRCRLTVALAAMLLTLQAQVITNLGRENMRIPHGNKPERPTFVNPGPGAVVDTASVYYRLVDSAQVYMDTREWASAEDCLRRAVAEEPGNPGNILLLSNIATLQRRRGDLPNALRNYNLALDFAPNAVTLLLNRAALYVQMDSIARAEADYRRVRTLDPNDTESRYSLGMLAVERRDFKQAEDLFNEVRRVNANSGLYAEGMAMLSKANGNYNKAIQYLSEVIDVRPNATLLANRADCRLMVRQLNDASDDIQSALAITPDDPYLYVLRAKLNKMRFNYADMNRDLELAAQRGIPLETGKSLIN